MSFLALYYSILRNHETAEAGLSTSMACNGLVAMSLCHIGNALKFDFIRPIFHILPKFVGFGRGRRLLLGLGLELERARVRLRLRLRLRLGGQWLVVRGVRVRVTHHNIASRYGYDLDPFSEKDSKHLPTHVTRLLL
jgi:hypothetical protein